MTKNTFTAFPLLLCMAGSFLLGKTFGTYSHSVLQESKYPFYLREILAKNMLTCSDYRSISNSGDRMEIKTLKGENNERVVMVATAEKSQADIKLLVSIINMRHEQYFDEVFLDCP
jgi:hypothetical protein